MRPRSPASTVELLDGLAGLGLGTFCEIRSRFGKRSWGSKEAQPDGQWVERLNEEIASLAFQEADPRECWNRRWDQRWRLLAFDIPSRPQSRRQKLWRWLKQNRLGMLQRSFWISSRSLVEIKQLFHDTENPHTLILWEALTPAGLDPISIAERAWDMAGLDADYQSVISLTRGNPTPENIRKATFRWRWAVHADPLLPKVLYPKSFRGFRATEQLEKMWSKFLTAGT